MARSALQTVPGSFQKDSVAEQAVAVVETWAEKVW